MKINALNALTAGILALAASACEKNDGGSNGNTPVDWDEAYVIPATVDETTYLVTASSLDEGSVTTRGNGTEVLSGTYWIYRDGNYLFSLSYNKGGAGTGASYYLNTAGKPTKKLTYECNRITTYGTWGHNIITVSTGDSKSADDDGNIAQALLFNYLDTRDGSQTSGSADAENFLGNGEVVTFAGIVEDNGRLYTSVIPMGMSRYAIKQWPDKVTDQSLIAAADGRVRLPGVGCAAAEFAGAIPRLQDDHPGDDRRTDRRQYAPATRRYGDVRPLQRRDPRNRPLSGCAPFTDPAGMVLRLPHRNMGRSDNPDSLFPGGADRRESAADGVLPVVETDPQPEEEPPNRSDRANHPGSAATTGRAERRNGI